MALPLDVDYRRGKLIILAPNSTSAGEYTPRPIGQNDNVPIKVSILDDDGGAYPVFTRRAPAGYGLRVGLFRLSDGLQLAYQSVFTADATNKVYTGNLTANSANQITALATASEVEAYLEIEITEDGGANYETPLTQTRCVLKKELIATAASTVPVNETAVTVANLPGLFAALIRGGFILRNDAAAIERNFYLDDVGQFQGGGIQPLP